MNNKVLIANGFFLLLCLAVQQYIVCGPLRELYEARKLSFELDEFYRIMSGTEGVLVFIGLSLIMPIAVYSFSKISSKRTAAVMFVMNPLLFGFFLALNHTTPHAFDTSELFGVRSVILGVASNSMERKGGIANYIQTYYGSLWSR